MKSNFPSDSNLVVIVGVQNGDEGKGRITQLFIHDADIVCRPNAGSNAQHIVTHNNKDIRFRHIPVGAINPNCTNILGAGMVVNPVELTNELLMLQENSITTDKIFISDQVHLVFPVYRLLNRIYELHRSSNKLIKDENFKIGSGAQGYGIAMEYKASKKGLRLIDFIDLTENETKNIKSRLQLHILDIAKNYIDFYRSQIPNLYEPQSKIEQRQRELDKNIIRTYGEELTRLLVLGLFEKNKKAIEKETEILKLRTETAKFSYSSNWEDIALKTEQLVKDIFGLETSIKEYFYDAELNFHIINKAILLLKDRVTSNSPAYLRNELVKRKKILFEGAQGTSLDVTHGLYPNSASGSATISGMLADAGVGLPKTYAIGVCKPYMTTTGTASTVLPTELTKDEYTVETTIRNNGNERDRKICWLDIPLLKNNIELNGITTLGITHLDGLTDCGEIKICVNYLDKTTNKIVPFTTNRKKLREIVPSYISLPSWKGDIGSVTDFAKLPDTAQQLIKTIANLTDTSVSYLTVGPDETQTILCSVHPENPDPNQFDNIDYEV